MLKRRAPSFRVRRSDRLAKRQRLLAPITDVCEDVFVKEIARHLDPVSRRFLASTCVQFRAWLCPTDADTKPLPTALILASAPLRFALPLAERAILGRTPGTFVSEGNMISAYAQNPAHQSTDELLDQVFTFASGHRRAFVYKHVLGGLLIGHHDALIAEWQFGRASHVFPTCELDVFGTPTSGYLFRRMLLRDDFIEQFTTHAMLPDVTQPLLSDSGMVPYVLRRGWLKDDVLLSRMLTLVRCLPGLADTVRSKITTGARMYLDGSLWGITVYWHMRTTVEPSFANVPSTRLTDGLLHSITSVLTDSASPPLDGWTRMRPWWRTAFISRWGIMQGLVDAADIVCYGRSARVDWFRRRWTELAADGFIDIRTMSRDNMLRLVQMLPLTLRQMLRDWAIVQPPCAHVTAFVDLIDAVERIPPAEEED